MEKIMESIQTLSLSVVILFLLHIIFILSDIKDILKKQQGGKDGNTKTNR